MTWLIVFVVMLVVVAGMAIGVMAGRHPLMTSCQGAALLNLGKECPYCGGDRGKCKRRKGETCDEA